MSRKLVAYFSASGTTAKIAERPADAIDAGVFEIVAQTSYTKADLDWMDKEFRTTLEMQSFTSRPTTATKKM